MCIKLPSSDLKSAWRSLEKRCYLTEERLNSDRLHFRIIRGFSGNNEFNAIKYLYDRLNIIDAKAQGLLTRNGLLFTVVSILGSVKLRDRNAILTTLWSQVPFFFGFGLIFLSTIFTFTFITLKFDNITKIPDVIKVPCDQCVKNVGGQCSRQGRCTLKIAADLEKTIGQPRTFEDYTETFFEITLRRQFWLRRAQVATFFATIFFFVLIGQAFFQSMTHPEPSDSMQTAPSLTKDLPSATADPSSPARPKSK